MPLILKFDKHGRVEMQPVGYPGGECTRMTTHYAKNMAGDVARDRPTAEATEPERCEAEKRAETA